MMGFSCNLKISAKMIAGFAIVALIAGVIGGIGIYKIRQVKEIATDMYLKGAVPLGTLVQLGMNSQKARVSLRGMMLDTDRERMEANAEGVKKRYDDVERQIAEFEKSISGDTGKKELEQIKSLISAYKPIWQEMVRLQLSDRREEALEVMRGGALSTEKEIEESIRHLIEIKTDEVKRRELQNREIAQSAIIQTVIFSVIGVLLAIFLGIFCARMITRPIKQVVELAERIAEGDLTHEVVSLCADETGQLARSMNRMTEQLNNILATVTVNSDKVAHAAVELTRNSETIATDTEAAASQAVAVSTSSEEMAATSEEIAKNCLFATEGVKAASSSASDGASVVQATVLGMNRIADKVKESAETINGLGRRSDEIGSIISTIEDIAEQTNLLALNAAIEAARAGEQGRGFAVVADEVRALAERTTKATKEIGEMIKGIQSDTRTAVSSMENGVSEVEKGIEGAARSGDALNEIIGHISGVTSQVNQIATAAEEQTATTNEISGNIFQMTQVIRRAADGATNSATAARQLAGLSDELKRLVGRFRLKA